MLFKDRHIPMIRSGSKTVTRREWDEDYPGPNVGSVIAATTELFVPDEDADCYIRITDRYRQPLGKMTDEYAIEEGDYTDLYDFKQGYEEVYGEGGFDPYKTVDVVEFEYVGRERPDERTRMNGECYNPNCSEPAEWSEGVNESYCSEECALEARSGTAHT